MAKGTGKTTDTKGEKPANTAPKAEKKAKPVKELVTVTSGALSLDVGPAVIAGLAKSYEQEQKANQIMQAVESKRYDLLSQTTAAIVKAAKADDSIDLSAAFSGDTKKMNVLNDQLGLALGFREVQEATDAGGNVIKRIGTAKAVAKFFPGPSDAKDSEAYKRKNTLRTNWLHTVKKCAQAASGLIETKTEFVQDKATGTLQITGPEVKKTFGQETVLLNEKVTVGEGDTVVKLTKKPSFTAVADMGAKAAGKVLEKRKDSRVASNAVDPAVAIQTIAKSLSEACGKLKLPADDATKRALSIALTAIDKVLKGSQPTNATEKAKEPAS